MKIAMGLVFAFVAIRLGAFDLLLDPIGWWLCLLGVGDLRPGSKAGWLALGMAVLSAFALIDTEPMAGSPAAGALYTAGSYLTVWAVVDVVVGHVHRAGDSSTAALLDVLRWAVVGPGAIAVLSGLGYARLGEVALIVSFGALAVLIVALWRLRA
ncbi:hypothetical protein AB0K12_09005 [Nonomuraea sp. NPDC049419]|uniref:hypothetical protein n=1 Tax=Nonomuraea sp. NPDC049419 TaxID=3155772 RepID=UPI0034463E1B